MSDMPVTSSLATFFNGALTRVNYVTRYSGTPTLRSENIAEHSFQVAMIAATIAIDLGWDPREVLFKGLLHDIEESLTGDVIRDTKYFDDEILSAMKKVEQAKAHQIFKEWGAAGPTFRSIWEDAKDDTVPGKIVALADFLSVVIFTYHEMSLGNKEGEIKVIQNEVIKNIFKKFREDSILGQYARDIIYGIFPESEYEYE